MNASTREQAIIDASARLVSVVRLVENFRHAVAVRGGFADTDFKALARVSDAGQLTPKDLSLSLDITTGAVTAISDRLVTSGHLERVPNPEDRRSLLLRATPRGRAVIESGKEGFHDAITAALSTASLPELRQFITLLERTTASLTPTPSP